MAAIQTKSVVLPKTKIKTDSSTCAFKQRVASEPIEMEIVFGRPSKDCIDIGICRINFSPLPRSLKQQCNCKQIALAFIHQNRNGMLIFRFQKKQMNPKIINTQFKDQQFTVLEPYLLPEPLQRLYCPKLVIEKGVYPIKEKGNDLIIEM